MANSQDLNQHHHKFFSPGILLCVATLIAIFMENSPLYNVYDTIKDTPVVLQIGLFKISKPLLLWINDGLMAIFFLLIGLEIKREVIEGQLSNKTQISLPIIAAIGGAVFPAVIYALVNQATPETMTGWAIPTATDIAFTLGILIMLGDRIPASLKICLVAVAIIDDLIAILIIALFYTAELSLLSLLLAGLGLLAAFTLNRRGVSKIGPYMMIGLFVWACVLKSGIHATLAGVVLGLFIPLTIPGKKDVSPLKTLEHALHPWVVYFILPVFAFVNAGVSFANIGVDTFFHPVTLGIILGLFVGKQAGVMLFSKAGVMLGFCKLPDGVSWTQFYGMALLMGVGFTMSLFIGTLAFETTEYVTPVRIGVLTGSLLSALCGIAVLMRTKSAA